MLNAWEKRRNERCLTNNSDSGSCGIRVLVQDSATAHAEKRTDSPCFRGFGTECPSQLLVAMGCLDAWWDANYFVGGCKNERTF